MRRKSTFFYGVSEKCLRGAWSVEYHATKMRNPYRRLKTKRSLSWSEVAGLLDISPQYARKLGCGIHRSVPPSRAVEWERRTKGDLKAIDVLRWALEDRAA